MVDRTCDCGCKKEFTVTGVSTVPYWQHPEEGGKYFATAQCRTSYLEQIAHRCIEPSCEIWILDGRGSGCAAHKEAVGALIASCEAGIPSGCTLESS